MQFVHSTPVPPSIHAVFGQDMPRDVLRCRALSPTVYAHFGARSLGGMRQEGGACIYGRAAARTANRAAAQMGTLRSVCYRVASARTCANCADHVALSDGRRTDIDATPLEARSQPPFPRLATRPSGRRSAPLVLDVSPSTLGLLRRHPPNVATYLARAGRPVASRPVPSALYTPSEILARHFRAGVALQ
ncbi:hypothetical protein VTO73DRAFT_2775 [Trametes versicolor]